ncbi:hypothetical protein WQ54_04550 [Bacillus sp. SA1-12]|uniref:M50 family metallopeptidase n=1 Tax=Bacillus sp. SA1-12 TaxID=1455638 RepID=UPI0006260B5E|nr:M50 family metallopeptidase [Bacillus sp. SA1-12]KKI93501.1 hypothetical protein WQ54_04550 [Bacillus sp. SA1-12]
MNLNLNFNYTFPIYVYLLTALIVSQIPYVRVYFSLCNTLLHEVIRVILTGGVFNKMTLHNKQNLNSEHPRFTHTLINYAGYTGESLAAIGLFYLVSKQNYEYIIYLFIGVIGIAMLFWIRNVWGILWALSFSSLLALPIYFRYDILLMHISILLASFILIQSIMNGIQVCMEILLKRRNPALSGFFARIKIIPAMILGVILLGQSVYTGYFIVKNIISLY